MFSLNLMTDSFIYYVCAWALFRVNNSIVKGLSVLDARGFEVNDCIVQTHFRAFWVGKSGVPGRYPK